MILQRAGEHLIQGLAFSVALHEHDVCIRAIVRATHRTLASYQLIPDSLFRKPSLTERIVDSIYVAIGRRIPEHYLEDARASARHAGSRPMSAYRER